MLEFYCKLIHKHTFNLKKQINIYQQLVQSKKIDKLTNKKAAIIDKNNNLKNT